MVSLVGLDDIKLALRIDGDDSDPDIDAKAIAASEGVMAYIKTELADYLVSDSPDTQTVDPTLVPERVKQAVIAWVGHLYDGGETRPGYPPDIVVSLLYDLREPTLA